MCLFYYYDYCYFNFKIIVIIIVTGFGRDGHLNQLIVIFINKTMTVRSTNEGTRSDKHLIILTVRYNYIAGRKESFI